MDQDHDFPVGRRGKLTPLGDERDTAYASALTAYAVFVVGTGLPLIPDQYLSLTRGQRSAIVDEVNRLRRR